MKRIAIATIIITAALLSGPSSAQITASDCAEFATTARLITQARQDGWSRDLLDVLAATQPSIIEVTNGIIDLAFSDRIAATDREKAIIVARNGRIVHSACMESVK